MADLELALLLRMTTDEGIKAVIESGVGVEVFVNDDPINGAVFLWMVDDYWAKYHSAPNLDAVQERFPGADQMALRARIADADSEHPTGFLIESLQRRFAVNKLQKLVLDAAANPPSQALAAIRTLREESARLDDLLAPGASPRDIEHEENVAEGVRKALVQAEIKRRVEEATKPPTVHLRERLLTLDDLAKLPPTRALIDGLVYRNTSAQLSGGPGTYKSFLAIAMGCCLAVGKSFAGFDVPERATVIYVAAEGANDVLKRILAWCELWGVDPEEVRERFHVLPLPIQLGNVVDVSQAVELVTEIDADILILDTRARCTLGLEENSATEQGQAIESVETIRQAADTTVLAVHHTPRTGNAGRGSNAWDGAVWSDLRVEGINLQAKVHCEKHKEVASGCDHLFGFSEHVVSENLMPQAPEERDRTTLVMSGTPCGHNAQQQTARRVVVDVVWTLAPPEGLSASELVLMSVMSRTSVYDAIKWGAEQGHLRNIGSDKRSRWVPGEQTPSWRPPNE